ncbi:serine hydrolase FSH [Biscogniauxia mediterranea]|nr:serine hydrolase FSH [Biscogniauxia mediterranea]
MRFLCLHGIGTSTAILETQLAALRYRLGEGYEYEYIEGSLTCSPSRGIEEAFGRQEEYYAYFDASVPSILKAVNDLVDFLDSEGPFDGVIGFSQGGALALTLIAAEERGLLSPPLSDRTSVSPHRRLRCAILLSCGLPWDYAALQAGKSRRLTPNQDGCSIHLPMVHFWGENDEEGFPGNHDATLLCDESSRVEFVHTAGHGVPSGSKAGEVDAMALAVESMIQSIA